VGSSEAVGSEASASAVVRPLGCPRVCCARAQRDWEAGSDLEESAVRTAFCWPLAIRARCWRVMAAGRLVALRVLMS
jgi:hypothetical protein